MAPASAKKVEDQNTLSEQIDLEVLMTSADPVAGILPHVDYAFQPVADAATGVVYAYETLLRGVEVFGLTGPQELFDFAYQSKFLPSLEIQLAQAAFSKFKTLTSARGTKLFFNFDGRGLDSMDPRMDIIHTAKSAGIPPSQISLEFSSKHKSFYSTDADIAIKELRAAGFLVSLDCFGGGFSDLPLLHDVGPDFVKIDRSLTSHIEDDSRRKLFITTVVNLAHVLGSRVIATGVETQEQYEACHQAGCGLIQGYFVAKPFLKKSGAKLFYAQISPKDDGTKNEADRNRIVNELSLPPTIQHDASIKVLMELFVSSQDTSFIPVLDGNEPRGLINEQDLKAYLYAGSTEDPEYSMALDLPLHSFVRQCPIADLDGNPDMLMLTFTSSLNSDGVIITENFRYSGFLPTSALLKIINEKRLAEAQDQNPLTHMSGNSGVNKFIENAGGAKDSDRHLCYIDFDNFKPFNDKYGFDEGDKAIKLFSDLMKKHVSGNHAFCGHIGGDDFFAGFISGSQEEVLEIIRTLKEEFRTEARNFYKEEHKKQGYIQGVDRFGVERQFPLLDCSICVVTIPQGSTAPTDQLNKAISSLKSVAKEAEDGIATKLFRERRG